ncbi:MAG: hypothetical protein ACOCQQ_02735 [Candidatus Nanoarchaeia archaeon]
MSTKLSSLTKTSLSYLDTQIRRLEDSYLNKPTISKEIMITLAKAKRVDYVCADANIKKDIKNHYENLATVLDIEERRLQFTTFNEFCIDVEKNKILPSSMDDLINNVFLINPSLFFAVECATEGFYIDIMQTRLDSYNTFYYKFM